MRTAKVSGFVLAGILTLAGAGANAELIHRYSFTDAAAKGGVVKDSVGKVDGKLKGDATVADGKLVLKNDEKTSDDAALSYLEFDGSVLPKGQSATVAVWFTVKDAGNFSRVIDFGDKDDAGGKAFIYVTPRTADGNTRVAITASDAAGKTYIDIDPIDDGKPHMLAMVVDGKDKKLRLYVDGKEAGPAADLGENTLDKVDPVKCRVGKSAFDSDAGLTGAIDELRVYDHAMTAEEAAAAFKAGADALPK